AAERVRIETCFLAQFARGRLAQRLAGFLAAGHRLPLLAVVRALEQQHAQVGRMHDHQRGDGNLVGQCETLGAGWRRRSSRPQDTNTQNGLWPSCQYSDASDRISVRVSQSTRYSFL